MGYYNNTCALVGACLAGRDEMTIVHFGLRSRPTLTELLHYS